MDSLHIGLKLFKAVTFLWRFRLFLDARFLSRGSFPVLAYLGFCSKISCCCIYLNYVVKRTWLEILILLLSQQPTCKGRFSTKASASSMLLNHFCQFSIIGGPGSSIDYHRRGLWIYRCWKMCFFNAPRPENNICKFFAKCRPPTVELARTEHFFYCSLIHNFRSKL